MAEDAKLRVAARASAALTSRGEVHCSVDGRGFALLGASPTVARAALALADGTLSFEQMVERLAPEHREVQVRAVLDALVRSGVLVSGQEPARSRSTRIAVLGNRTLLSAIDQALADAGYADRTRVALSGFAKLDTEAFRSRLLTPVERFDAPDADQVFMRATREDLVACFGGFDLVVCALEAVPYEALLEVNRSALDASTPCLFVTSLAVGPLVMAGSGPCFACLLLTEFGSVESVPFLTSPALDQARQTTEVAAAALALIESASRSCTVMRLGPGGERRFEPLLPHGACPACRTTGEGSLSETTASVIEIARTWPVSPQAELQSAPQAYRSVCIVGGGTAGYLSALALRRCRPELEVTLIESSKIPVIGVGEATTPELVKFLHARRFLDKDVVDLHRRVRPTLKLGIKFMWGPRDFPFPFQRGRLLESKLYAGDLCHQSLSAMLMMSDRAPVLGDERGERVSLAHVVRWAYHLENRRFVRYLREEALAAGIRHVDAQVTGVKRTADGHDVAALMLDGGREVSFDLYLDCSGFRALLIEGALESPFVDWSSTLATNRAIVAVVPHDGTIKPYTLAETMDAGWCWNIPFEDEDHRGYVFCSDFSSPTEAEAEMRAKNPEMGEAHLVRFRSGRHAHFWKGNVVALGNAYGFVEPLESTALHMLVLTLELLTTHFPASRHDTATIQALNRKVGARWDALRWFLGTHYRYNHRLTTPFWRAQNAQADVSGAEERVGLFRERAPLSYRSSLFYTVYPPEFFSDDHSYDTLLMGQQVEARLVEPTIDRATWSRRLAVLEKARDQALPQAAALRWLRDERPDALAKLKSEPRSWLHTWIPA